MHASGPAQLLAAISVLSVARAAPPPPGNLWRVWPPIDYSDVLFAGWEQIPVEKEVQIYDGVAENRTYAHHPELFAVGNNVFLIHSSAVVDEDSMGQDVWISASADGGATWGPSRTLMPAAMLPNQTEEFDWKYWCDRGIAQRAWQALGFVHLGGDGEEELYAIGQSGSRWCPGRWATAGRIARKISLEGEPLGDPCWIEKNEFTESQLYAETVYGTEYGMKDCVKSAEINAALVKPNEAPAWSPWLYNNGLVAADGTHQMEEQTFAVWHDDEDSPTGGYWQRHWRDISPERENTHSVWVEYNEDPEGDGWYPKVKNQTGNEIYKTNIPDAKTKQFLGQLGGGCGKAGDGDRYLLSNPRYNAADPQRQPLTLAMSRGKDQRYTAVGVLRTGARKEIVPDTRGGIKNRAHGFSYPTAVQVGDRLVVAYSENKENIWVSIVDVAALPKEGDACNGGTVLSQLLDSSIPAIGDVSITVLVRKQEQADLLREKGLNAVLFNGLDDSDQLRAAASEHDYIIHTPTGFHTGSAVALIEGLGERSQKTGKDVHFIHTSGTSNLAQRTITKQPGEIHDWSDKDDDVFEFEEKMEAEEAYGQRMTDIAVIKTAERAGVKSYIMMPPTVYGRGTGHFNQGSMQIPSVIRGAIKAGQAEYVGDGTARLGHVHVTDLALLYELVFGKILAGEELRSGRRGIYFSNTGNHSWHELATEVGKAGVKLGALKTAEPRSVSLEEAGSKWLNATPQVAEMNYAAHSSTKPVLATELGWKPKKTEQDWEKSFVESFQMVLDEQKK
ncbi:BNR repeat domain-containing protein [Colletotrichum musicola]|uniref:BNR repeat domain-containing protein n=1 Tax=Colletotrichum musicola TaxID=2175873 RepID=A0A8H6NIE1_9PEZI|nr:BNR repeat domain-containing protein [Colletotrichum musicola]